MTEQGPESGHVVELCWPDGNVERHMLKGLVEAGRDTAGLKLADPAVSRRHVVFDASAATLTVTDQGSSNGTIVNGGRIQETTALAVGDEVRIGDTTITVVAAPTVAAETQAGTAYDYESFSNSAVEVRYLRGTHGEKVARSFAARAVKARHKMQGLGSEGWGVIPVVNLVDPFLDPDNPGEVLTEGSIIDNNRGEAWIVVTPEAPPEDPHRVLALLFGAALPSAADLTVLLEGYGLHLADFASGDEQFQGMTLPQFDEADPELRALMAVSFVRFLLDREGDDTFRRVLAAPSGRIDVTAREMFGAQLARIEDQWRIAAVAGKPRASPAQFLRLSVRYLRPYRRRQAEIFVYMLMSLAFVSAFPFVTRRLFDTAIPSGEFSQILDLLVILGIAFSISLLAGVRQAYQTAWVSGAVTRDIQQSMFDKLQHLPAAWFHRHSQGDVLSRLFNDVGQMQAGLSDTIAQGIFQALSLVVSAVIMLTLNVPLGIIVLLGAPLVAVVYRSMASGAQTRSIAVQENSAALLSVAAENYRANPIVKTFGLAGRERRRFGQQAERLFRSQRRISLFGGLFGLSVNMIVTVLRLAVLGFGGWLILDGRFTTGGLVAFLAVMGEVLTPVTVLSTLGQEIQAATGSLMRINEVLDTENEAEDAELPRMPLIQHDLRLVNVSFSYTPERRALDGINLTIPVGSRVAFVGPSGSGKSTILRLLTRMYEPDEGSLLVDGLDVRQRTLASWRDQVGVVFQDSFLFDTTLRENIALGQLQASEDEIVAAAAAAEVDAFVPALSHGYDTLVGEEGGNLSGGQRQRVAIARALVRNPRILLLDEATSALDPLTERQINETLQRVSRDRTVVAITHQLASVVDYDRIFVIVDGRLAQEGTHDELLSAGGAYARLWAEQTGAEQPAVEPFDHLDALQRVPLFRDLDPEALAAVATKLRDFSLGAGEVIQDGGGLIIVRHGRAEVLTGLAGGRASVAAELSAGDTFGLASALGSPPSTTLQATEPMSLLLLDNDAIALVAAENPSVWGRLSRGTGAIAPPSGIRLTHVNLRPAVGLGSAETGTSTVEEPVGHRPTSTFRRLTR